ncbi:MAG: sulfite exporter TauE/SafE family protein, partial [Halobacteriaceae archaeon]
MKSILGFVSGLIFGLTNIAVQVVTYLDSLSLDRSTFVGVLAMILIGISGLRVVITWLLGMYQSGTLLFYSAIVAVP